MLYMQYQSKSWFDSYGGKLKLGGNPPSMVRYETLEGIKCVNVMYMYDTR